jgi:hypothetical protein
MGDWLIRLGDRHRSSHDRMMEGALVRYPQLIRLGLFAPLAFAMLTPSSATSWAQGSRGDIDMLRRELEELRRRDEENRRRIEALQRQIESLQAAPAPPAKPAAPETELEKAIQELPAAPPAPAAPTPPPRPGLLSRQIGATTFRLIDISLDVLVAAGFSTENDESLQTLQGGGHDPRKRGFTLQQAELSLRGAVDPYFTGESHIVFFIDPLTGETEVELEEAFFTTLSLPYNLQVKGGFYLTEFGLINPAHPHAWDWLDQPVINTRLFGADGMRQAGARVRSLLPLPWYSEFYVGVQNADGETMASFYGGEIAHVHAEGAEAHDHLGGFAPGIGGRPIVQRDVKALRHLVYSARWVNAWDLTAEITSQLGLSGAFGPNTTGRSGYTQIYGADLKLRWRPTKHFRGYPFLTWQSEFMARFYKAAPFTRVESAANGEAHEHEGETGNGTVELPKRTLVDWGFYSQLLYGFRYGWAAGLRGEYASGRGASVGGRDRDPFRDNRLRLSPLLSWRPTEFSRIRLQYNYDRAEHLEFDGLGSRNRDAHSVWLGFEYLLGTHPAHRF